MKILIVIIVLLISSPVFGSDWSKKDTAYQLTYTALHIIDWGQTRNIVNNGRYYDNNPVLGKHPSMGEVNTYFILTLLGYTTISYILPSKYRRYWQVGTIVIQSGVVGHNFNIGLKVDF